MISAFAPAKLNLCLHVTGLRDDGYHLLDSLVMHVDVGDRIWTDPQDSLTLSISGPFGKDIPSGSDNLIMRAASLVSSEKGAAIRLEKNLPPAAGIGGGSSDAAATVRALCDLWQAHAPDLQSLASLGADVPVCMSPQLTRMRGVGEKLDLLGSPPELAFVLINPRTEVSTPRVFADLERKSNSELGQDMPDLSDLDAWLLWLSAQRNDLEKPASGLAPIIVDVLDALNALPEARVVRMSGSGATCFAIMKDSQSAKFSAQRLQRDHHSWWVKNAATCFASFR
jgi:4-diphosphocytidyl-2-C-methyl-D-erythritol kinase